MSSLSSDHYGLSETDIGLTFIANRVGSIIGTLTAGSILNSDYRRVKAEYDSGHLQSGIEVGHGTPRVLASVENSLSKKLDSASSQSLRFFSMFPSLLWLVDQLPSAY
jgi:hypothetical protein